MKLNKFIFAYLQLITQYARRKKIRMLHSLKNKNWSFKNKRWEIEKERCWKFSSRISSGRPFLNTHWNLSISSQFSHSHNFFFFHSIHPCIPTWRMYQRCCVWEERRKKKIIILKKDLRYTHPITTATTAICKFHCVHFSFHFCHRWLSTEGSKQVGTNGKWNRRFIQKIESSLSSNGERLCKLIRETFLLLSKKKMKNQNRKAYEA
jgi:hypothetical protein